MTKPLRCLSILFLLVAMVFAVCGSALAGPFFSSYPGAFTPSTWADVDRHVTYSSRTGWRIHIILPAAPQPPVSPPNPKPAPQPTPQPEPRPVVPPGDTSALTAAERNMLTLLNEERVRAGLSPLQVDMDLVRLARMKSEDMVARGYFGHVSPTYGSPFNMMDRAGIRYRYAGENLAGAPTVEAAHRALMASPGHRANILNPNFTHVGIGVAQGGPYRYVYTQMFIGR